MFNLERFRDKNKLLLFLLVTMVIMPMMEKSLDFTRTNYHWLKRDGLKAVDVVNSNVSLAGSDDEVTILLRLELIDYSREQNRFKIRMYLPRALSDYTGKEFYEFENDYVTNGNRNIDTVMEQVVIKSDEDARRKLFDSQWHREDLKYELYNENEVVEIIKHGL